MAEQYTIENADVIPSYRNFAGRATKFKEAGTRKFSIRLETRDADALANAGWNVKLREPDPERLAEGAEAFPFIDVEVGYKFRPPKIVMISSVGRTTITEDTVEILDAVDFATCDVILNPSSYDVNGKQGIKAYLKTMFVTIEEDELERKYALKEKAHG